MIYTGFHFKILQIEDYENLLNFWQIFFKIQQHKTLSKLGLIS